MCDGTAKVATLFEKVRRDRGESGDISDVAKCLSTLVEHGMVEFSPFPITRRVAILGGDNSPAPIHATVELTERCNLACVYCYRDSGAHCDRFLEEPIAFLQNLFNMGIRVLELSGGEPLLHPQIGDILKFGLGTFNHVGILTNGTAVSGEIEDLAAQFKHKCVVQVSLPSITPGRYKLITGADALDRVLANMVRLRRRGIPLRIGTVITDEAAIGEIAGMADLAHRIGALQYVFTPMLSIGRGRDLTFSTDAVQRLHETIENLRMAYPRGFIGIVDDLGPLAGNPGDINCGAGVRSLTFDPGRKPRPCPVFPASLGSLKMLNPEARQALADIHAPREELCADCPHVYCCKGCLLRGFLKWRKLGEKCRWGLDQRIGERISAISDSDTLAGRGSDEDN